MKANMRPPPDKEWLLAQIVNGLWQAHRPSEASQMAYALEVRDHGATVRDLEDIHVKCGGRRDPARVMAEIEKHRF